jgi:V8-like Glu-specific endopeptidase
MGGVETNRQHPPDLTVSFRACSWAFAARMAALWGRISACLLTVGGALLVRASFVWAWKDDLMRLMIRAVRYLSMVSVLMSAVWLEGCGSEDEPSTTNTLKLSAAPQALRTIQGRRFRLVGPVLSRGAPTNGNEVERPDPAGRPIADLTVEELASAIRGRSLVDGYEYEEESALDRAQLIHDHLHGVRTIPSRIRSGSAPTAVAAEAATDVPAPANFDKNIFGPDNRTIRGNTTTPGAHIMVLTPADSPITATTESRCTAALIGRETALAAAHCFWDPNTDQWRQDYAWAAGFDSEDADIDPFGQRNRCYVVTIPSAFTTANGSPIEHDYAVIDFTGSCGTFPGDLAGWFATKVPEYTNSEIQQTSQFWGYPSYTASSCAGVHCRTRIWGSSGALTVGPPHHVINHMIDESPGQSGSPVFRFFENQWFQVGIHKGVAVGQTANWARRINLAVNNAIDAWSDEY